MSGGGTQSVKRHLDVDAEGYDVQIRRFIPHYDDMIATGVELLAALAPADGHVLDLGGGTGALSSAVPDGLPGVRVTIVDVDADMLGTARRRLARFPDRVVFHEGSFLDPLPAANARSSASGGGDCLPSPAGSAAYSRDASPPRSWCAIVAWSK
ncbi:MAG: class I SAM-dependent methyltransferase [Solirubrobacteraceae bacterium]